MVIGRDPMCDVSDSDPLLSRRHAEFKESASDVRVRDLGSRNGILVNGVKQAEAVLRAGDVVQIGHLQVKYVEEALTPSTELDAVAATVIQPVEKSLTVNDAEMTIMSEATVIDDPFGATVITSPSSEFVRYAVPGHRLSFELPAKGWTAIGGGATTLALLAHSSRDGSIAVERASRPDGVAGSSSALANAEVKVIREANPSVSKIDATAFDDHQYTSALLNYSRQSTRGAERVFQFSCVDGPALYRLTCSAVTARFDEFESVFTRAAATFDTGSSE
jgi:pSer/pThr/pTyr-binding forkhead associated (FHA) protein